MHKKFIKRLQWKEIIIEARGGNIPFLTTFSNGNHLADVYGSVPVQSLIDIYFTFNSTNVEIIWFRIFGAIFI